MENKQKTNSNTGISFFFSVCNKIQKLLISFLRRVNLLMNQNLTNKKKKVIIEAEK